MTITTLIKSKELITDQICARFRREIEAGKYAPNSPLPSFSALAESYGISKSTVHAAFAELEGEGYLFIKHGKGAFVNPAKIIIKKTPALADVALVAFNIFSANDNYMISLMEAMNNRAAREKIRLHFLFIQGMSILDPINGMAKNAISENQFQGLLLLSPLDTKDIQWLSGLKVPFVAATSHYDLNVPQVLLDHDEASRLAVEEFTRAGKGRIAVLTGPLAWEREGIAPYASEIRDGLLKHAKGIGLSLDFIPCEYSYADSRARTIGCLNGKKGYDGYFFQSDIIAKGAMAGFREQGADTAALTLINYCDLEDYLAPISIRKPLKEMGEKALSLLEETYKNRDIKEKTIILKPQIIQHRRTNG